MEFEILGEIRDIETIATGRGVYLRRFLERAYGKGRWRKRKGKQPFDSPMELSATLRYTGSKRTGLAARISKLSR